MGGGSDVLRDGGSDVLRGGGSVVVKRYKVTVEQFNVRFLHDLFHQDIMIKNSRLQYKQFIFKFHFEIL